MASSPTTTARPTAPLLTADDIRAKSWRYLGYKGFSEWLASDDDFFIVRRFDTISARVILLLQWELTKLEARLAELDRERSYEVVKDLHNGKFEDDDDDRQALIKLIQQKLAEYHAFLIQYSELRRCEGDTTSNIRLVQRNVQKWFENNPKTIHPDEANFVNGHNDLMTISPVLRTPLRGLLEKLSAFRRSPIFRRHPQGIAPAASTIYTSNKRVDFVVNAIISMAGFVMLAAPLWILFYVQPRKLQLIVITVFIAVFLSVIQSVSVARPFECLAATAAYSAVLMVFMQISPQS